MSVFFRHGRVKRGHYSYTSLMFNLPFPEKGLRTM